MGLSSTPSRSTGLFWPFIALGVGVFLLLSGAEYLLVGLFGKQDTASVTHATEVNHYRSGKSYEVFYEFTTEDGAQYSGTASGFVRKPGAVRIRVLHIRPFPPPYLSTPKV